MERITFQQYMKLIANHALDHIEARIELIHGELRELPPFTPPHSEMACRIYNTVPSLEIRKQINVWIHNPIGIPDFDSCPEPDVAWVKRANYWTRYPRNDETLLIIEVAEESLEFDCDVKVPLYASAGIPDCWVVSLPECVVRIYREPADGNYQICTMANLGDAISPLAFPQFSLSVSELFGP